MLLNFGVCASVVAKSWAGYFSSLLENNGIHALWLPTLWNGKYLVI